MVYNQGRDKVTVKKGGAQFAGGETSDRRGDFQNFWLEGEAPPVFSPQWKTLFVFIKN